MADDLMGVANQAEQIADAGGQEDAPREGEQTAIGETQEVQSAGADNLLEGDVPPELQEKQKELVRAFHDKTQELAKQRKDWETKLAEADNTTATFKRLLEQPWFQKAYSEWKDNRNAESKPVLNEETYQKILADPRAFEEVVRKLVREESGAKLGQHDEALRKLTHEREFDAAARDLGPEFKKFNDDGLLEPHLRAGYDFKAAYALAKLERGKNGDSERISQEAQRQLAAKKAGAVGKVGLSNVNASKVLRVKRGEDAWSVFDKLFEAKMKDSGTRLQVEND